MQSLKTDQPAHPRSLISLGWMALDSQLFSFYRWTAKTDQIALKNMSSFTISKLKFSLDGILAVKVGKV